MNVRRSCRTVGFFALFSSLGASLAHAHPGHGPQNFAAGILHPITGLDHMLAMIAVGLWAVQLGGRALWMVPSAFVSLMAIGGTLGIGDYTPPMMEQGILASVFILGLAIAFAIRLPLIASVALVGLFALYHGAAHGSEMPVGGGLGFGAGMLLATAALHGCGIGLGLALSSRSKPAWIRVAGAGVLAGAAFLAFQ